VYLACTISRTLYVYTDTAQHVPKPYVACNYTVHVMYQYGARHVPIRCTSCTNTLYQHEAYVGPCQVGGMNYSLLYSRVKRVYVYVTSVCACVLRLCARAARSCAWQTHVDQHIECVTPHLHVHVCTTPCSAIILKRDILWKHVLL